MIRAIMAWLGLLPPRAMVESGRVQLKRWIHENMPELAHELAPMTWSEVRVMLNEVTGLELDSWEPIDEGALKYLDALKAKVKHV